MDVKVLDQRFILVQNTNYTDNIRHNLGIGFIRKDPLKIVFEDIKNYFKEKNGVNVEVVEVLR